MGLRAHRSDANVDEMNGRWRSTAWNWWGLGFALVLGTLCVILILTGVVGGTVWWTAAAMGLLAISSALNIRAISRNNSRLAAARTSARSETTRQ